MIKFLIVVLACLCGPAFAASVDVWKPGYVWDAAANTGVDVWYGPGNKVTTNGAFARGANVLANAGGYAVAETGSVLLRDGRAVSLTATRLATAGAMATAAARLASGPVGIIAVLAIPSVYDWITAEGGNKIRVNPTRTGVDMSRLECVAPCGYVSQFNGRTSPAFSTARDSQQWIVTDFITTHSPKDWTITSSSETSATMTSTSQPWNTYTFPTSKAGADSKVWYPSSMDDISPYMTPRLPAQTYPKQIIDAGGEIDVTPVSVTGPSPALVPVAPHVVTTQYPKPVDQTSTTMVQGNPFNLVDGAPAITGGSTGSAPHAPGSSSTSGGPLPAGTPEPVAQTINTPTKTTSTSTFDAAKNQTTTTTTTSQEPHTQTTTVTNTTNITNTTNTSNVTNSTTTTTVTTNNTTNETVTKTDAQPVKAQPAPEPAKDPCEANPDRVGCMKLDDVPTDKVPTKTVTITWAEENLGLGAGSCPAPTPFHTALGDYSLDLTQYCSAITSYVRPLVLLFSLLAAFFIVAPVKET